MTKEKWLKLLVGIFAALSLVGAGAIGTNPDEASSLLAVAPLLCAMLCIGIIQKDRRDKK